MATVIVKENDGHAVRVTWRDSEGNPFIPSTVRWRIDCMTTGQTLQSWVSLTPGSVSNIDIPGSSNRIISAANSSEVRQITVQANAGLASQRTVVGEYVVQNNDFVA